jgi:hypothetical protein
MWLTTTDLPTAASHPFYRRLNQLLREHGFDDFAEGQCAPFYADNDGPARSAGGHLFPAVVDWLLRDARSSGSVIADPEGAVLDAPIHRLPEWHSA